MFNQADLELVQYLHAQAIIADTCRKLEKAHFLITRRNPSTGKKEYKLAPLVEIPPSFFWVCVLWKGNKYVRKIDGVLYKFWCDACRCWTNNPDLHRHQKPSLSWV